MALTAAQIKAERIAAEQEARTDAYQASLTAAPKTQAQQAAIKSQADATVSQIKLNEAVASNPLTKVTPAPAAQQVGPNIGANAPKFTPVGTVITGSGEEVEVDASGKDKNGGVPVGGTKEVAKDISQSTKDAFAAMTDILKQWGLESLADTYGRLMVQGFSAAEALNKLKYDKTVDPVTNKPWNAAYTVRFAGNAARVAKGLNAYDEATYLDVENQYADTLNKYGLNNMIKPDAAGKQAQFAGYMANDIAPTEFAERIQTVADRVINMDPAIKAQFQAYYPSLSNTDIVSYFLDPKETLPVLKNKVTAAEIGAVAGAANYGIAETRAMDLAKFGVSRAQALAGYQDIAEVTPTAGKLSSIYNEEDIKYGQTEAENEFLKQDAQAKLKRNRLASKERAMFGGQSGVNADTFGRSNNF
jgi:hypothetical protein